MYRVIVRTFPKNEKHSLIPWRLRFGCSVLPWRREMPQTAKCLSKSRGTGFDAPLSFLSTSRRCSRSRWPGLLPTDAAPQANRSWALVRFFCPPNCCRDFCCPNSGTHENNSLWRPAALATSLKSLQKHRELSDFEICVQCSTMFPGICGFMN